MGVAVLHHSSKESFLPFEMLEVLARFPVTAPLESVLGEEFIGQVVVVDFVGERFRPVTVFLGSGGLHLSGAVGLVLVIGIIQRVNVNGQSSCVLRQLLATGNVAIEETGGVVRPHLQFVIGIVFVGQFHLLDLVSLFVEGSEYDY